MCDCIRRRCDIAVCRSELFFHDDQTGEFTNTSEIYCYYPFKGSHNLINQDTVEDYILSVLYDKIMLFELTIGDLELIFGDEVEYYQRDIFDLYMKTDNMSSFKNKLGVLKEKTLNKKNLAENFKDFDRRVFENFDLSPLK